MWAATSDDARFSSNTSPTSPRLGFRPLLTCGALSCSWQKRTSHIVNRAQKQCASLFKTIMSERVVVSRPPPHYRDTEGLLHNLRPGCSESVIKGCRLGRPDPFLTISYTEHKDLALYQCVWDTIRGESGYKTSTTFLRFHYLKFCATNSIKWWRICDVFKNSGGASSWGHCGENISLVTNNTTDVMMCPAPNPGSQFGCFSIAEQVQAIYNQG